MQHRLEDRDEFGSTKTIPILLNCCPYSTHSDKRRIASTLASVRTSSSFSCCSVVGCSQLTVTPTNADTCTRVSGGQGTRHDAGRGVRFRGQRLLYSLVCSNKSANWEKLPSDARSTEPAATRRTANRKTRVPARAREGNIRSVGGETFSGFDILEHLRKSFHVSPRSGDHKQIPHQHVAGGSSQLPRFKYTTRMNTAHGIVD